MRSLHSSFNSNKVVNVSTLQSNQSSARSQAPEESAFRRSGESSARHSSIEKRKVSALTPRSVGDRNPHTISEIKEESVECSRMSN